MVQGKYCPVLYPPLGLSRAGSARERSVAIEDRTILVPHPLGALDNFVNEIKAQNVLIHEL